MGLLVYFCATNCKLLEVLNGNERGSALQELRTLFCSDSERLATLVPGYQVFLENLTGDYYSYDKASQSWLPQGNVGLHNGNIHGAQQGVVAHGSADVHRKAQKYKGISQSGSGLVLTGGYAQVIEIKAFYRKHWALKGIEQSSFVADCLTNWDPHPININKDHFVQMQGCYSRLADNIRGPQIAEHINTLVCQFAVKPGHRETSIILANFVEHMLHRIATEGRIGRAMEDWSFQKVGVHPPVKKRKNWSLD